MSQIKRYSTQILLSGYRASFCQKNEKVVSFEKVKTNRELKERRQNFKELLQEAKKLEW